MAPAWSKGLVARNWSRRFCHVSGVCANADDAKHVSTALPRQIRHTRRIRVLPLVGERTAGARTVRRRWARVRREELEKGRTAGSATNDWRRQRPRFVRGDDIGVRDERGNRDVRTGQASRRRQPDASTSRGGTQSVNGRIRQKG